jgi:hypothetical protein
MRNRWTFLAFTAPLLAVAMAHGAQILYDGSLGTTPQSQGWLSFASVPSGATTTTTSTQTTLDTTSNSSIHAGYSNYTLLGSLVNSSFPTLNPTTGFTVNLNVQINSESHSSNDRAGFSLIAIGSDDNGIELGFWTGDIWAQSSTFTHSEDASFNTTSAAHQYALTIQGGNYTLYADGSQILTGATRNYSAAGAPYTLSNYLFIGDDTTSASGAESISSFSVSVPEPSMAGIGLCAAGLALLARPRRRLQPAC